jgi:glycolate oxidase
VVGPAGLAQDLRRAAPTGSVRTEAALLQAYAQDGYTLASVRPRAVVWPGTADEVAAVMRVLHRHRAPVVARGGGTSLSGGATPVPGGVVVHLSRLNRILNVDIAAGIAEVEPGVVNAWVSRAAAPHGYAYRPDPSSQQACTIGGNIGENAGGPHCLKYGVTLNHVLMADVVWADGSRSRVGSLSGDAGGLDALALVIGSEGTLGIVTRAWVRLQPLAEVSATVQAVFDTVEDASRTVSDVMAAGIVPAALEMMDQLAVSAVERGQFRVGYPANLGAVLLVEVDGLREQVEDEAAYVQATAARHQVRYVRRASSEAERMLWWANRKTAFGAMGLISPDYYVQDGVIPRSRLPEALRAIEEVGQRRGIRIANVFHAGDGNLHPLLLYNGRDPSEVVRVQAAGHEVLDVCLKLGGSVTGEHGIGVEKREDLARQLTESEMAFQRAVKAAFDPQGLLNPGKIFM